MSTVSINPPDAVLHITQHASDWLWAAFSLFTVFDLAALAWHFRRPAGQRFFHQLTLIILTVSALAYFSMASDLGATPVTIEFIRGHPGATRDIWYVRYIQWVINAPLLLIAVLLVSGASYSEIFVTVFMSLVLVVSGLVGSLVRSTYKWGYFVFGVFALFYVLHILLIHSPRTSFAAGTEARSTFLFSAGYITFFWLIYPICWALSEGGNVISPTGEMIFYGILDLLAGPVFLFFFLYKVGQVEYEAFGLGNRRGGSLEAGTSNGASAKKAEAGTQ